MAETLENCAKKILKYLKIKNLNIKMNNCDDVNEE